MFLSPDAFAHRTAEASIAEQLSDVLANSGLPRAVAAHDARVGGWQLMYQLMETDSWSITENCGKLIECLPLLIRDERRVEDIRKVDGDDAADAARYGLVSGGRLAGVGAGLAPPGAALRSPHISGPHFVTGMPLGEQIERQVSVNHSYWHKKTLLLRCKILIDIHSVGVYIASHKLYYVNQEIGDFSSLVLLLGITVTYL